MSSFATLLLLMVLSPLYSEGSEQIAWNTTAPRCPSRKRSAAELRGQTCLKSCERNPHQCRHRLCLCDGACGLSCVSQDFRCSWPVTIDNAETRLAQESNTFGSLMEVTCKSSFRMADGQKVSMSRCQGDRKWSFTTPCEDVTTSSSLCKPPPEIENGFHGDGPYKIGRYRLEGASTLLCQENQEWSHKAPICLPHVPQRVLRSGTQNLLTIPGPKEVRLKTTRDRAFSTMAPTWWNQLPEEVRALRDLTQFRRACKTTLFRLAYAD